MSERGASDRWREQARKIVATRLQDIYGEFITQGSPDDWYEDADRVIELWPRLRPLLDDMR
jgi:hypothetical protein